ncbi:MAG: DUF4124 domain-containing protein [Rhodocyclaceae bacterium]|nr:DUF4124 domain-containing protein [Rhodocyclaceae bacterium]MBX3671047.1 DUF4124 domain-containing protein [Rhodocyclaceae bacterium]
MVAGRCLSAVLAALLALPAAAETVYRWVDSQGVTHFDQAPPPGVKAERKELGPPAGTRSAPAAGTDWSEANRRFDARHQEQRDADREAQEKQLAESTRKRQRCEALQARLGILQRQAPVFRTDAAGERAYLDDAERAREIERTRAQIDQACSGI